MENKIVKEDFSHLNFTILLSVKELRNIQGMQLVDEYYQLCEDWEKSDTPDDTQQHEAKVPTFHIAENRKTDTMKIFNYMYDLGLFVDKNGKELKRQKKQFMTAIGKFFDEDFEKYAQTINSAAQEEHFMDIFHDLLDKAQKKYLAE